MRESAPVSEPFGMHVEFRARPGHVDELESILLEAADGTRSDEACRLYVVSRSPEEERAVCVTEAWTSREAHDASLEEPDTRSLIARAMPLLDGAPHATPLIPRGGKGFEGSGR